MATVIGGSVDSINLAGRDFSVPADADFTISKGGDKNERKANGDRTARVIKEVMVWMVEGAQVSCSARADDLSFLQNLADGEDFDITITFMDQSTLNGSGGIEGEVKYSTQNATASFGLSGSGTLEQ